MELVRATPVQPLSLWGLRLPALHAPRLGVPVWLRALSGPLGEHEVLAAAAALLLYPALTAGAVRWQDDTKYFYYPLLANLHAAQCGYCLSVPLRPAAGIPAARPKTYGLIGTCTPL